MPFSLARARRASDSLEFAPNVLFHSTVFLFVFLPLALALYFAAQYFAAPGAARVSGTHRTRMRWPNAALLLASLTFYTWTESLFTLVLLASVVLDYSCARLLGTRTPGSRPLPRQRWILAVSICSNLLVLGVFKYLDFATDAIRAAMTAIGVRSSSLGPSLDFALPLGISFYTFQSMSYTIDVFRGRVAPTRSFIDFACYVTMFPQLVAGPIVRYRELARSLENRFVRVNSFASGVQRFTYGLGKKVLIADALARTADVTFAEDALASGVVGTDGAWVGLICYALQIYYDFSGYSDMAIGLGRMLGFSFAENFRHPYASTSLREFWRRWHISLSTWFRDYLYLPLGGNRRSRIRTLANLFTVFLVCGLWHGAEWHFVLWGLLHGAVLFAERTTLGSLLNDLWRPLRHMYLLFIVLVSWVFFRCASVGHGLSYFETLFTYASGPSVGTFFEADTGLALFLGALLATPIAPRLARLRASSSRTSKSRRLAWELLSVFGLALILFACWMRLAATTHQPFIYFRF